MSEPSFSIHDFKKWMQHQEEKPKSTKKESTLIGHKVESRLGIRRLNEKIQEHNPNIEDTTFIAEEFKISGGFVIETIELQVKIKTKSGHEFMLPKFYTKNS